MKKSEPSTDKKTSWWKNARFVTLAIAGAIFFGSEGFDGITAILGLTSLPMLSIFLVGALFAVISVVVFFVFDLVEISHTLGVDLKYAPRILDKYLEDIQAIKNRRKELTSKYIGENLNDILIDIHAINILIDDHKKLNKKRLLLLKSLDRPTLKIAKAITAIFAGLMFFSSGFFAGQTVAMAFAGLFLSSVSFSFWPIIVASVLVGLAAFAVYWYFERPAVENLIGRWVGLDKEKIDELCTDEVFEIEHEKLLIIRRSLYGKYSDVAKLKYMRDGLNQATTSEQNSMPLPEEPSMVGYRDLPITSGLRRRAKSTNLLTLNNSDRQDIFDKGDGDFSLGL